MSIILRTVVDDMVDLAVFPVKKQSIVNVNTSDVDGTKQAYSLNSRFDDGLWKFICRDVSANSNSITSSSLDFLDDNLSFFHVKTGT